MNPRLALPRVILGNRGDIASRWGVLLALRQLGIQDISIFCRAPEDMPEFCPIQLRYGRMRNLLPDREGLRALRHSDLILWAVGLDFQDDSSLAKLMYLSLMFYRFRQLGKPICILFQGAGPLTTRLGRFAAALALRQVDHFIARDPATLKLVNGLAGPRTKTALGYDAIFLPGFEQEIQHLSAPAWYDALWQSGRPVIGINLRQWFHFTSSLLPYELSRQNYLKRSQARMQELMAGMTACMQTLRQRYDARLLLLSAYQPGVVPWEDDLPWLEQLKAAFVGDAQVQLISQPLSMLLYYHLMSRLDLMIAMRLHSSLIALRFGVPAVNLSYTLKGRDIYQYLGLSDNVLDLPALLASPRSVLAPVERILANPQAERARTRQFIDQAVRQNMTILQDLLNSSFKLESKHA